jgi:outer membrane protein TolC
MMQYSFPINRYCRSAVRFPLVALGLAGALSAQPADSLTPEQAVRIVLGRNPSIAQAKATLEASRAQTQSLYSSYYPQFNATGSYVNVGPNQSFGIPLYFPQVNNGKGGLVNENFNLFPMNNYDAHVGVSYTLFDFGKRSNALESSRMAETSGVNQLRNLQLSLCYQVVQLYHVAILQGKSIGVKDEEIADRERHVAEVKRRVETGSATEFDALQAEELLAAAKSERIDMVNGLAKLQEQLHELLGLPQDRRLFLAETRAQDLHRLDGDSLIACALNQRSDYAAAKNAAISARLQVQKTKLENMPTLGVQATGGAKNGILPNVSSFQGDWTAGVEATVPIFDGNRAKYHRLAAEADVDAADAGISDLAQRIRTQVLQTKSDVEAAYAKLDLSAVQVQLAERALTIAHIKYEAGVITNIDVLDAEKDFSQAKLAYVSGQYQYLLNLYNLDQATGAVYAGMK